MSNSNLSTDELVNEIDVIRDRLAATIDELVYRVKPSTIVSRQTDKVKAHFVDASGNVRTENVVPIVIYVSVAVVGITVLRKLFK